MLAGFDRRQVDVGGVTINCVVGGRGPAVLLLHGYPQNLSMWAKVAAALARDFTVVCADLRGYGDSAKPACAADFSTYSFRAMAADQVGLMRSLGFDRFHVAGHDRGGRVAHRMALDWPGNVASVAFCDMVPTHHMYASTDRRFATTFWLWFFLPLPEPFPERLIGADADFFFESCLGRYGGTGLDGFDADLLADYRRCWRDPAMIHASCCDYRAGATIDLDHDQADVGRKLDCPVLALWGADGLMGKMFDFLAIWRDWCQNPQGGTIPGGHFFPEQQPEATARALQRFFGEADGASRPDERPEA